MLLFQGSGCAGRIREITYPDARRENFLAPLPVGCATRKIVYLTKQIKIFLVAHPTGSRAKKKFSLPSSF